MDQWLIISLRIIHILTSAAWVGGAFLLVGFSSPPPDVPDRPLRWQVWHQLNT